MNFDDSAEEAAFRTKARAWIAENAPAEYHAQLAALGIGHLHLDGVDTIAAAKAWQKTKYDAGWAALRWPEDYGGAGATPIEQVIWTQEEGPYSKLSAPFFLGFGMCGPTLMGWASEDQKRALLPKLASGEEVWCQLFSEPSAGSDLAGIRTRAVRDGDEWVVDGQKIWTSGAHDADWGLLITRTDPAVVKHRGLTMFFLDMKSPGVEVRPIWQANEQSNFNEVYFTGVRIPDAQRLGAVGQGWTVALTTLMHERMSVGGIFASGFPQLLELCETIETASGTAIDDPQVQSHLAGLAIRVSGLEYINYRAISALSRGEEPGPESSIGKLVAASMIQELSRYALDLQGEFGIVQDDVYGADGGRFQDQLLRSVALSIEGGSDQILRNIIAERVLGLPADIRADKDMPFDKIPTSAASPR